MRIFNHDDTNFDTLGIGSLDETITLFVRQGLNGIYELEMEYPVTGRHYDNIKLRNIIMSKPDMYTNEQPFRIYSITKPINGIITIIAEHISYDASGIVLLPKRTDDGSIESYGILEEYTEDGIIKNGYSLQSILDDINTSSSLIGPGHIILKLGSDKVNVIKEDGYKIGQPMNLRSVMGGVEGSILDYYKGEYSFDRYNVTLHNELGKDRGLTIRYGKNMTDLEQETGSNSTFTAIYPFYSKSYTVTNTTSKKVFQDTYIIDKITPLRSDWLSLSVGDFDKGFGIVALVPIVDYVQVIVDGVTTTVARYVAVKIKTPGEYYDRLFAFKKNTVTNGDLINAYINNSIKNDEETILELKLEDGTIITPKEQVIYIIKTEDSTFYNRKIIYDKGAYTSYNSDGFYMEVFDAAKVNPNTPLPSPLPVYKIRYDTTTETWVRDDINGKMYVEAQRPSVVTESENKYVYVDLKGYEPEEPKPTLDNGNLYVNAETQSLRSQRILTLDLTSALDDIGGLEPTQMTQKHVFDKAEQYLKDNDLTKIKESIKVSFIRLSDSPEYKQFKDLERVSLGDTVNVIYDELGVSTKHRVIATEYDAITNSYVEIELGDKIGTITDNVVSFGDNISDLKNDAQYTDKVYVTEFVAENASIVNAAIQNAIIETLQVSKINISGLLEASVATIDTLVAQLLTAENAVISDLLEAGSIRVKGNITALSGDIGGSKIQNGKLVVSTSIAIQSTGEVVNTHFLVDEKGNVLANSLSITGGDITIGTNFSVDNAGIMKAKQAEIEGDVKINSGSITIGNNFSVNNQGKMKAENAEIEGDVKINSGSITIGSNFSVDSNGIMKAKQAEIEGDVKINSGSITIGDNFSVDNAGIMKAKQAEIEGDVKINSGSITIGSNFSVDNAGIMKAKQAEIEGDVKINSGSITIGSNFSVDNAGIMKAKQAEIEGDVKINSGSITLGGTEDEPNFSVDSEGRVFARSLRLLEEGASARVSIDDGKLKAENADIIGTFRTVDMHVRDNITFNAENVKLGYVKINNIDTHYRYITFNRRSGIVNNQTGRINYTVTLNSIDDNPYFPPGKTTLRPITLDVTVSYTYVGSTNSYVDTLFSTITFEAGSTVNTIKAGYVTGRKNGMINNVSIHINPSTYEEWYTVGTDNHALGLDADFAPKVDNKFVLGNPNFRWSTVYAASGSINTSDRTLKDDINYDISKFDELFYKLKPSSFKYIDGTSGRTHLGLIAQDVKESLDELDISDTEFAAFIRSKKFEHIDKEDEELVDDDYVYGLRYSELHALQIRQIQLLKEEIRLLKEKIK